MTRRQRDAQRIVRGLTGLFVSGALLAHAGQSDSVMRGSVEESLSTSLLGRLQPGGEPRLAMLWEGSSGALLDVWVDLDGDGELGPAEMVVTRRPLEPGIEVVRLEIPAAAYRAPTPRLRVRACAGYNQVGSRQALCTDGCNWQPGFNLSDLGYRVYATAVYDDGTGAALYAAGGFETAGDQVVNFVARWDGSGWSPLSDDTGTGLDSWALSLAVFDDGTGPALYVGGGFTMAAGTEAHYIARWDGRSWSALTGPGGTGVGGTSHPDVYALTVHDDGTGAALYVGGGFTIAGGVEVGHVARWDGSTWSSLAGPAGTGTDDSVQALASYDDGAGAALYAGGRFDIAGGVPAPHVARWDGSGWSALSGPSGVGTSGTVSALTVFDDGTGPALYSGGSFATAGGLEVHNIARWNGAAWSALSGSSGNGTDDVVKALSVHDDGTGAALYAGGFFAAAGGVEVNGIARWDGSEWTALSGPAGAGMSSDFALATSVVAFCTYDDGGGPGLYAGGYFATAGGLAVDYIARWRDTAWSALSQPSGLGLHGGVGSFAVYDDGTGPALYVGGPIAAGRVLVHDVARWDGQGWSALSGPHGTGLGDPDSVSVSALAVYDHGTGPALYVGGRFSTAGGIEANNIARWDGTAWSALGNGVNDWVRALEVFDDGRARALYVGGEFENADGRQVNHIASWNGYGWSMLVHWGASGVSNPVRAMCVHDDGRGPSLYVGGEFHNAGSLIGVHNIARWNGISWSAIGGPSAVGTDDDVHSLAVYDDGRGPALYAGGRFVAAGGVEVHHVARWDGDQWSALSGPSGTGLSGGPYLIDVRALTVFDDGTGPALHVGGNFDTAGGVAVGKLARWDGDAWSALIGPAGNGMNYRVSALEVFDDGSGPALYAGGDFSVAGGLASEAIAVWKCWSGLIFADGFESGDLTAWGASGPRR